ncbi:MAG: type VI secretion system protein, partial [Planctomycetia bacterium]|nr:type VI secretion system protein [Planctomycetia bacterium]
RLHHYWLPLLFVLLYVGAWLGYWFFRLLTDPRDGSHPDIDDAWTAGLKALNSAGIDPTEVPLFMVIGKPRTDLADFFAATRLPFAVRAEPRSVSAPVQLYATRDAVFVVCPGASVLCKLADLLAAEAKAKAPPPPQAGFDLLDSPDRPVEVLPGDLEPVLPEVGEVPVAVLDEWLPRPGVSDLPTMPADEAERLADRLKYLCRLLAERRRPFCPANGIVWLLPTAGTASEALAERTAAACRADLLAAEAGLQVHCPAAAVICDAQDLPGFRDLVRGIPEPLARERLLGRSFPLVPAVSAEERPEVLFNGIDWVARNLLPGVAYQRFGSEAEGNGERWSAANARLWMLLSELHARRSALVRLLGQGITDGRDRLPLLAGAYLVGTGPAEQDQAFAAGVVQQLIGLQNNVGWTPAALAEERDYHRMTIIGYGASLVLIIAVGLLAYLTWLK